MPSGAVTYRNRGRAVGPYRGFASGARAALQVGRSIRRKWDQYQSGRKRARTTYQSKMPKSVKLFKTVGALGKAFKKPMQKKVSPFLRTGWVNSVETGGEISSTECPYIGHGFAWEKMLQSAIAAIVRRMLRNMSFRIASWDDVIVYSAYGSPPGGYILIWRSSPSAPFTETQVGFNVNSSWQGVVDAIYSTITTIVQGNDVELLTVDELVFYQLTAAAGTPVVPIARSRVFLSDIMIHFDCTSAMSLQNRTRASTDVAEGDAYSKENILNNPLGGKSYEGFGTGAIVKEESNSTLINKNLAVHGETGVIQMDWNEPNMSPAQTKILRRPPAKTAFLHVNKQGVAGLKPGEIRTSRLYYKKTLALPVLLQKLFPVLRVTGPPANVIVALGKFRFFSFEKRCNTRVNEASIEVGYELNIVYRCSSSEKQHGAAVVNTII